MICRRTWCRRSTRCDEAVASFRAAGSALLPQHDGDQRASVFQRHQTVRLSTHRQLNPEELAKAGVSENMVRLSVGIEHLDDLQADLVQALDKV